jgi:cell wall-associated NlpC family hydrolase
MKYPNRTIESGEKDAKIVKAIQQRLTEMGIGNLSGTGTYGPKTVEAVKQFQAMHTDAAGNPLTIDGKVGAITWEILFGQEEVPVVGEPGNDLRDKALQVAISQIGVMEQPAGSNKGPEVSLYLATVGLDPGFYWCMAFVYWCYNEAAKQLGRKNPLVKTAGCQDHWNRTEAKKVLRDQAIANPGLIKPGSIFIIKTGKTSGHTGIVEKVEGGFIHTIEGNSNPAGSSNGIGVFRIRHRKINSINLGFVVYS